MRSSARKCDFVETVLSLASEGSCGHASCLATGSVGQGNFTADIVVKYLKLDWNCIRLWILDLRNHEWKPLFAPTVLAVSLSSENREEWFVLMNSFGVLCQAL